MDEVDVGVEIFSEEKVETENNQLVGGRTFFGSLKETCPVAMLASFRRFDHGV